MSYITLPSKFHNNLIYIVPKTNTGKNLLIITDTGGGYSGFFQHVAKYFDEIYVKSTPKGYIAIKNPKWKNNIPNLTKQTLFILPSYDLKPSIHGFFGHGFFEDRIWNINYNTKQIRLYKKYKPKKNSIKIPIHIPTNKSFPSIQAKINNKSYWFLFDTGAMTINSKNEYKAISFLTKRIFDKWHKENPNWKIIKNLDTDGSDAIVVPELYIGTNKVENILFLQRTYQSEKLLKWMTGKPSIGALGGNVWNNFNTILNYPDKYVILENIKKNDK